MAENQKAGEDWKAQKDFNEERMILLITKLLMEEKLITIEEQSEMFRVIKLASN